MQTVRMTVDVFTLLRVELKYDLFILPHLLFDPTHLQPRWSAVRARDAYVFPTLGFIIGAVR